MSPLNLGVGSLQTDAKKKKKKKKKIWPCQSEDEVWERKRERRMARVLCGFIFMELV